MNGRLNSTLETLNTDLYGQSYHPYRIDNGNILLNSINDMADILNEMKNDETSASYIPMHIEEVVSHRLQAEKELLLDQIMTKLNVENLKYKNELTLQQTLLENLERKHTQTNQYDRIQHDTLKSSITHRNDSNRRVQLKADNGSSSDDDKVRISHQNLHKTDSIIRNVNYNDDKRLDYYKTSYDNKRRINKNVGDVNEQYMSNMDDDHYNNIQDNYHDEEKEDDDEYEYEDTSDKYRNGDNDGTITTRNIQMNKNNENNEKHRSSSAFSSSSIHEDHPYTTINNTHNNITTTATRGGGLGGGGGGGGGGCNIAIQKLEQIIQRLDTKVHDTEESLSLQISINNELSTKLQELQLEMTKKCQEYDQLTTTYQQIQVDNNKYKQLNTESETYIKELKQTIMTLEYKCHDYDQFQEKVLQYEELQTNSDKKEKQLHQELQDIKYQYQNKVHEYDNIQEQYIILMEKYDVLNEKNKELYSEIQLCQHQLARLIKLNPLAIGSLTHPTYTHYPTTTIKNTGMGMGMTSNMTNHPPDPLTSLTSSTAPTTTTTTLPMNLSLLALTEISQGIDHELYLERSRLLHTLKDQNDLYAMHHTLRHMIPQSMSTGVHVPPITNNTTTTTTTLSHGVHGMIGGSSGGEVHVLQQLQEKQYQLSQLQEQQKEWKQNESTLLSQKEELSTKNQVLQTKLTEACEHIECLKAMVMNHMSSSSSSRSKKDRKKSRERDSLENTQTTYGSSYSGDDDASQYQSTIRSNKDTTVDPRSQVSYSQKESTQNTYGNTSKTSVNDKELSYEYIIDNQQFYDDFNRTSNSADSNGIRIPPPQPVHTNEDSRTPMYPRTHIVSYPHTDIPYHKDRRRPPLDTTDTDREQGYPTQSRGIKTDIKHTFEQRSTIKKIPRQYRTPMTSVDPQYPADRPEYEMDPTHPTAEDEYRIQAFLNEHEELSPRPPDAQNITHQNNRTRTIYEENTQSVPKQQPQPQQTIEKDNMNKVERQQYEMRIEQLLNEMNTMKEESLQMHQKDAQLIQNMNTKLSLLMTNYSQVISLQQQQQNEQQQQSQQNRSTKSIASQSGMSTPVSVYTSHSRRRSSNGKQLLNSDHSIGYHSHVSMTPVDGYPLSSTSSSPSTIITETPQQNRLT